MHRWTVVVLASVVLMGISLNGWAQGAAPDPPDGRLILSEKSYCRFFGRFGIDQISPAQLRAEGEKWLGTEGLRRLGRGKPLEEFADKVFVSYTSIQCTDWNSADYNKLTPPIADDWVKPGFDDSSWLRQKMPLMAGRNVTTHPAFWAPLMMGRRQGCFRYYFEVPDPEKAGKLLLNLAHNGGVRVFLNGREIARAHLPAGDLGPDAVGDDYPLAAYVLMNADGTPVVNPRNQAFGYVSVLEQPYDEAPIVTKGRDGKPLPEEKRSTSNGYQLTRAEWNALWKIRTRELGVELPRNLLVKGANVLAIDLRTSRTHPLTYAGGPDKNWIRWEGQPATWSHCHLLQVRLKELGNSVPSTLERPAGVQVYAEDVNRIVFTVDYLEPGAASGTVRIAGANNGTFAGRLVVGTDHELKNLKVVVPDLLHADGKSRIAASAVEIQFMRTISALHMADLGFNRSGPGMNPLDSTTALLAICRYAPDARLAAVTKPQDRLNLLDELAFYDHLSGKAPESVPAGVCQPVWLSLRVPADAVPGTYKAAIRVTADGMEPRSLPLEVEISGWRIPDPANFRTYTALELSQYAVAKQYGVKLWSAEHLQKMAPSLTQAARIGNRWLWVPVLSFTELGNLQDASIIQWTRRKDGTWAFDFTNLDRYLDLALKHQGTPDAICFLIMHGGDQSYQEIQVFDEAKGASEIITVSPKSPEYRPLWTSFGLALFDFMKKKGLQDAMCFGFAWDNEGDPMLPGMMAEVLPSVMWAKAGHGHWYHPRYRVDSALYKIPSPGPDSWKGWNRPNVLLLNPREGGSVLGIEGASSPFVFRLMYDRAITCGLRGIARIGGDFWGDVYMKGWKGTTWLRPGMPVEAVFYPGEAGSESSTRFEAMIEGVQETEARIFLEQTLDRKVLPEPLAKEVQNLLRTRNLATLYLPSSGRLPAYEEYAVGWQDRSRNLFAAAAQVAAAVPLDLERNEYAADVPAKSKAAAIPVKMRNWTATPRRCKVESAADWLKVVRPEGTLTGQENIPVVIDASSLKPESTNKAELTLTDVETGVKRTLAISAKVGKVLHVVTGEAYNFLGALWPSGHPVYMATRIEDQAMFNVTAGSKETKPYLLANLSGAPLDWRIESPAPWLTASPPSGTLAPLSSQLLQFTASPPDKNAVTHTLSLTALDTQGGARDEAKFVVNVIPPYVKPKQMPQGRTISLFNIPKGLVTRCMSTVQPLGACNMGYGEFGPQIYCGLRNPDSMLASTPQIMTFDLEHCDLSAFSATVALHAGEIKDAPWMNLSEFHVNFEVVADGAIRAQSGLMSTLDEPRTIVAENLGGVKRLTLRVRFDTPEQRNVPAYRGLTGIWTNPRFYFTAASLVREGDLPGQETLAKERERGWSALHHAALYGKIEKVRELIEAKADVNALDVFKTPPLNLAAFGGRKAVVETLLAAGAKVDSPDRNGRTALHLAAAGHEPELVDLLLAKGADSGAKDQWGRSALLYACLAGDEAVVKLLLERRADVNAADGNGLTPLYAATVSGNKALVNAFLAASADVNAAAKDGSTALFAAVEAGNCEMVELLLSKGAGASVAARFDRVWRTGLYTAVQKGDVAMVKLLLAAKADVKAKSERGERTALHLAAEKKSPELVKLLAEGGADVSAADRDRRTPLHLAAMSGDLPTVETLLTVGADKNRRDTASKAPADYAQEKGFAQIVARLK